MLSGTGIRDAVNGGYIELETLSISEELRAQMKLWLKEYEELHLEGYSDFIAVEKLDFEGIEICKSLKNEISDLKVEYYSDAKMEKFLVEIDSSIE
jgi:hypothetical protein